MQSLENWMVWDDRGSLKVNVTILQNTNDFPFVFNRNHAFIQYPLRDTASFCRKLPILTYPQYPSGTPDRGVPYEIYKDRQQQKTTVSGIPCCIICVILRLAVLT